MAFSSVLGHLPGDLTNAPGPSIEPPSGHEYQEVDENLQYQVQSDIMNDFVGQDLDDGAQEDNKEKSPRMTKTRGRGKRVSSTPSGGLPKGGLASPRVDQGDPPEEPIAVKPRARGNTRSIVRIDAPEEEDQDVNDDGDSDDDDGNEDIPSKPQGRGRGRPKGSTVSKSTTADVSSTKKRKQPGLVTASSNRPTRAAAESAKSSMAEQGAKRPKLTATASPATKSTAKSKVKAKAASASAPAARRGRPPGNASAPATKGRGRPPGKAKPEYVVEKVVDSRLDKKKGAVEYHVKWQGYPAGENTWEPAENLAHCPQKLAQYTKGQKKSK